MSETFCKITFIPFMKYDAVTVNVRNYILTYLYFCVINNIDIKSYITSADNQRTLYIS